MTTTPFCVFKLRGKRDALLARQRARRIASLLSFDPHEQACIAAGTFVIACQALELFRKASLCFQLEDGQLHIYAQAVDGSSVQESEPRWQRLSGIINELDAKTLYRYCKPLPTQALATDVQDLSWTLAQVEAAAPGGLFEEIVKQNQETLGLLHELRLQQASLRESGKDSAAPHAA